MKGHTRRLVADLNDELPHLNTFDKLQIRYIVWRASHRRWGKRAIKTAAIPLAAVFAFALTDNIFFIAIFTLLVWYYSLIVLKVDKA